MILPSGEMFSSRVLPPCVMSTTKTVSPSSVWLLISVGVVVIFVVTLVKLGSNVLTRPM